MASLGAAMAPVGVLLSTLTRYGARVTERTCLRYSLRLLHEEDFSFIILPLTFLSLSTTVSGLVGFFLFR